MLQPEKLLLFFFINNEKKIMLNIWLTTTTINLFIRGLINYNNKI
jgi:hypothetical protein